MQCAEQVEQVIVLLYQLVMAAVSTADVHSRLAGIKCFKEMLDELPGRLGYKPGWKGGSPDEIRRLGMEVIVQMITERLWRVPADRIISQVRRGLRERVQEHISNQILYEDEQRKAQARHDEARILRKHQSPEMPSNHSTEKMTRTQRRRLAMIRRKRACLHNQHADFDNMFCDTKTGLGQSSKSNHHPEVRVPENMTTFFRKF